MNYFSYSRKSTESEDRQVMSIESQQSELVRAFSNDERVDRVTALEERKSAKAPGRPVFDDMIRRIEAGEAEGILAWAPDRLARNSIDGGRIIYLLDTGVLRDLKFVTYTFENNSQGKFMLQIMFGQSKYYSDSLSENVKRGNRTKIEHGWRPNVAPLGYLNDSATKTIVPDPIHFPLIRQMFDLLLSGAYRPSEIAAIARNEWGFRTPQRRKMGGVPLAMSSIYKIFNNPFYAGMILWDGQLYPGSQTPIVSVEEFRRARALLAQPGRERPQKHVFPFTGLIRCQCGLMVTAEHKVNRQGHRYLYYHCTRRRPDGRCREPSVEAKALHAQVETFLYSLTLSPALCRWVEKALRADAAHAATVQSARRASLQKSLDATRAQMRELTGLRLRQMIGDEELVMRRRELQEEELKLVQAMRSERGENPLEPLESVISFSNQAVEWFRRGEPRIQRMILKTVGSNPVLSGKKLSIQAAEPFRALADFAHSPSRRGCIDDVRTQDQQVFLDSLAATLSDAQDDDPEFKARINAIKELQEAFRKAEGVAEAA